MFLEENSGIFLELPFWLHPLSLDAWIFILLADYAHKVAFEKHESFYLVIIIDVFLGIFLPSFSSLRVLKNGEQFVINHLWVMVMEMLVYNSFKREIEADNFL